MAGLSTPARVAGWLVVAFGALAVVGALLPWASAGPFSVAGTNGDGIITLPLGIVAVAAGIVRGVATRPSGWQIAVPIVALVVGVLVGLIGVIDTILVADEATVGGGLLLTILAGLGIVASAMFALIKQK
ncbi:hypothetical protein [Nocardioides sp. Root151]|uniref:hypothetical protein n=1 Tax=Nocardioides sp. Root151 TaxID=1736475 RepID=UPI00070397B7|nr:hypothetical protein [Nocardioides sp. Root151]KQZ70633.1 hypothetical protein ASD66_13715 [Nocardioides sp. Root151]